MKNRTKILILIILLLFLLSPPLKLPVTRNRDNIQIAAAAPTERVDNTTYTIYFAKAVPSVSESAFSPYHFVEVNVTGDVIDVEDAFDWLVARDAASCIDGSYSSFMVRGLGRYIVKATRDNLKITLKWGIMISTAIPALTPGTLHYYITFASSYAPGGYVSYSGSNTIKFQIFNATTGKYVNIFTSTYFEHVAIGSYTITSHLISNGYVYLKAYFESVATIETDAGGYIQIPNIAKEEAIFIYQLYISRDPLTSTVYIEHQPEENYVYHHLRIYNPEYATKIVVNKPSNWNFYLISPNATVTEYSDNITITDTIPTTYDIYFTSTDFWNYPRRYQTRISYFDQKGDYIPFESVFTYYNLSWATVTTPDYQALYSNVFTMDPAQYLSIKVLDRWGNILLEQKNLEYQEFYNFTLMMYTFKLVSFQDDFIYMMLKPVDAVNWYTEWIAPKEIEEEHLYPGTYNLTIQFKNGTEIHETFDLTTDVTYIVSGWTLSKLAGRVDINFAHFMGISLKNNYTGLPLSAGHFTFYINGTARSITTNELFYIEGDFADIEIYDMFNHLLYHNVVNVTATGWLNIGLNVTHLVLKNFYDAYGIRITLTSQTTGASKTFYIAPLDTVEMFIANDTYSYVVELMDTAFTTVERSEQGTFTIEVGQTERVILFGRLSQVMPITLRNNYTGIELPIENFIIYVNGRRSSDTILYIEGEWVNITVYDLFNHLLVNESYSTSTEVGWIIDLNVTYLVLRNPYEIYAINMTLTASTGVSKSFFIPPLESRTIFIGNDTYSYTVKLLDPELKVTLREVSGQFTIPMGRVEYIILFGWNIFPDVYMDVEFFPETGTINMVCEITVYMNYSKLAVPSVYLEVYVNNELSGTALTDSQGKAIIRLLKPLNGTGSLAIKASKLGVSRWFNTTYQIWGWITVEEPPYIVQGETATYNVFLNNPSKIGDAPIKIEDATIIFNVYTPNLTELVTTLNKSTIDIPPGTSQFTFALNTTGLNTTGYVLEIRVIYMNSTFAYTYVAFTVTPRPAYRIVVPWWLIIAIVLIALASFFVAWFVLYLVGRIRELKFLHESNVKFRPRTVQQLFFKNRKPPPNSQ